MLQAAVGLDIGGTNIKAGLVREDGVILYDMMAPTNAEKGKDQLLDSIAEAAASCMEQARNYTNIEVTGIGMGTAGFITLAGAIGSATANLPDWKGTPLRAEMERRLHLPAQLENDVNVLAIGEMWQGAGRGLTDFLCVSLGTGVGGSIITNGHTYRGRSGYAGAFGHQIIQLGGHPCTCGSKGCWEQYASVTSLKRQVLAAGQPAWADDPRQLFAQAEVGNETAKILINDYAEFIAIGLTNLIHLYNPPAIIIGGAISEQGDALLRPVRKHIERYTMDGFADHPPLPILPAILGNRAGIIGAAKLILT
ncbi:glucokinase [Paenibacillus sp. FSL H7-0326]|uniref:ROK family protein n=1 Tax=Paenibacillus sp. FSL H7-0326 TaxID=1921144 RepID=UPI00096E153E|nr:ROK family protein [Paenibacillus sp. FSL H7-0326]OMC68818.1 glucokinase [Paenibacillus sp. FSL H7-0326]